MPFLYLASTPILEANRIYSLGVAINIGVVQQVKFIHLAFEVDNPRLAYTLLQHALLYWPNCQKIAQRFSDEVDNGSLEFNVQIPFEKARDLIYLIDDQLFRFRCKLQEWLGAESA